MSNMHACMTIYNSLVIVRHTLGAGGYFIGAKRRARNAFLVLLLTQKKYRLAPRVLLPHFKRGFWWSLRKGNENVQVIIRFHVSHHLRELVCFK